jgi:hypothetical protein
MDFSQALVTESDVCSRLQQGCTMPRYFFHVTDGQTYPDHEGTELPGLDAARREAFGVMGDLLKNRETWNSSEWRVEIADAAG